MKKIGLIIILIPFLGLFSCDSNESLIDLNHRQEKMSEELERERYIRWRLQAYIDSVMDENGKSYMKEIIKKTDPRPPQKKDTVFIELPPADDPYVITLATELEKGLSTQLGKGLKVARRGDQVLLIFEEESLFEDNGLLLSQKGRTNLQELTKLVLPRTDLFLMVEGHSDTGPLPKQSSSKDHATYSYRRATAVVQALQDQGMPAQQLIAAGAGAAHPIADNQTEAGRYLNRRVVVAVGKK